MDRYQRLLAEECLYARAYTSEADRWSAVMDCFGFEQADRALAQGVVQGVADRADGTDSPAVFPCWPTPTSPGSGGRTRRR